MFADGSGICQPLREKADAGNHQPSESALDGCLEVLSHSRHWQPVRDMYRSAFTTSRIKLRLGRPRGLVFGSNGSSKAHSVNGGLIPGQRGGVKAGQWG
jgi:hypothetical protein